MARVISLRYGDLDQFSSPFFISDPQRTFFGTFSSPTWKLQTFYHPYVDLFIQQLNQGNVATAINQLQAFVNHVQGFLNAGVLTVAQGQPLIDAANNIIAYLNSL